MPIIEEIIGNKVVFAKMSEFASEPNVIAILLNGELRSQEIIYEHLSVASFSDMIIRKMQRLQERDGEIINIYVNARGMGLTLYDFLREQGLNVMPSAGTGNMVSEYGSLPRPVK